MVGEISSALEIIISVLFGLGERHQSQKHQKLGKNLLALYIDINDVVWNAENLVGRIRHFHHHHRITNFVFLKGREWHSDLSVISDMLNKQELRLKNMTDHFWELEKTLRLIDPQASMKLRGAAVNKQNAIKTDLSYHHGRTTDMRRQGDAMKVYDMIDSYLKENPPEERIALMKESAEVFRKYIIDHWELSEIL